MLRCIIILLFIVEAQAQFIIDPYRFAPASTDGLLSGLFAYGKLDEALSTDDAVDATGGTSWSVNISPEVAIGKILGARTIGSSEYFYRTESGIGGATGLTAQAWVKLSSTAATGYAISQDHSAGTRGWALGVTSAALPIFYLSTGTVGTVTATNTISTGIWYHLLGLYDGANIRLFVNGVEDGTPAPKTGNVASPTARFGLGSRYSSGTSVQNVMSGDLDEVAVWLRGLSSTNISDLYNGGAGQSFDNFTP